MNLTEQIKQKIKELEELLKQAENDAETKKELAKQKIEKPYNNKGRKVTIAGAIKSVVDHCKEIAKTYVELSEDSVNDMLDRISRITDSIVATSEDNISLLQWDSGTLPHKLKLNKLWRA